MKRTNKTKKNLEAVWQQLDDASGLLDQAFHNISTMSDMSNETIDKMNNIDITTITSLKNHIEEYV